MTLVPVTYVLFVLNGLRENDLYPGLPHAANYALAAVYIGLALAVAVYMHVEYYDIGTVRAGDWKLQVSENPPRTWLFNLREDPTERHDLSAAQPERVAELRALIEAHNAEMPPPLWPALIEGPVRIDVPLNAPWREDQDYIYWSN